MNCVHTSTAVRNSGCTFCAHSSPSIEFFVYTIELKDVHDHLVGFALSKDSELLSRV